MSKIHFNRYELCQYSYLVSELAEINKNIREIEMELTELASYNFNITPVYTGMPSGNEMRDKIADFIIRLEKDMKKLTASLKAKKWERKVIMFRLHKIKNAVAQIQNKQLREIFQMHYFEGRSVTEIASEIYMTADSVYKKINRYLKNGKYD